MWLTRCGLGVWFKPLKNYMYSGYHHIVLKVKEGGEGHIQRWEGHVQRWEVKVTNNMH